VVAALSWLGTLLIIKHLSVHQFGEYSVIFSLLGIVGFIADLRLSRIVLEEVIGADEDQAAEIVGSYTGLRLVIGLVSYVVAIGVVLLGAATGNYSRDVVLGTALGGLNLIILSVAFGLILLFEARLWLRDVALANILGQIAALVMIVGLTIAGAGSILWYVGTTVLNAIVLISWILFTTRRGSRVRLRVEPSRWKHWLKEAAPLALGAALDTIYFRIDVIMLSIIATASAAGIYNVGYKFSDLVGAIPLAVVTPALTLMVESWPSDLARFRLVFRHAYVILLVAAVGACIGFFVYAEPLIVLATKEEYRVAADSARLLVIGQGIHFFTLFAFTTLVAVKRHKLYPVAMLLGVVVNVGLNLVLIPEYSYLGAGWATVITEVLVLIALGFGIARIGALRPFPAAPTLKVAFAGVVMALVGWAAYGRIPWPVGLGIMAVVYMTLIHFLAPNGPGGLRAFAGEPHDDLMIAIEEGIDRPDLGTGMPDF
jgi:O-antigen/teichoic acid export membrane protein